MTSDPKVEQITAREAAVCLIAYLEERGAVFELYQDDTFWVDLNPVAVIHTEAKAEMIAYATIALRDEIRAVLVSRRVIH